MCKGPIALLLKMSRLRAAIVLVILLGMAPAMAAECGWKASFISPGATRLPITRFQSITPSMSVARIVGVLGPAAREVGSGLYVLQWDVENGRVFFVSAADACSKPISLGFENAGAAASAKPLR